MTWRDQAACAGMPATTFYPDRGTNATTAKRVCANCPVTTQCANDGADEPYGVWGGTTVDDRGVNWRKQTHRHLDVRVCQGCGTRHWTSHKTPLHRYTCPQCEQQRMVS